MPRPIVPIKRLLTTEEGKQREFSIKWLAGRISYLYRNRTIPGAINTTSTNNKQLFGLGGMYMFLYDPKTKADLPYWDKFPLVIPIKMYPDGYLGINLHYLGPDLRIPFMNSLITLMHTSPTNNITRMRISYDILNNASRFNAFVPCVKRYLLPHIKSKIMPIHPHEYITACYLPTAKFQKKSQTYVWLESKQMINQRKK